VGARQLHDLIMRRRRRGKLRTRPMPEKTIERRLTEAGDRELADEDGPIFSTVAKLVEALQRAVPYSLKRTDLELREEALRLLDDLCSASPGGTKMYQPESESGTTTSGCNCGRIDQRPSALADSGTAGLRMPESV
jgi:hypothetical protein